MSLIFKGAHSMLVAACCPFDYFVLEHFIFLSVDGRLQGIAKPLFMLNSRHEPEGLNLNYSPRLFHVLLKSPSTPHDSEKWVQYRMIFQRRVGGMHKTVIKWPKSFFFKFFNTEIWGLTFR